MPRAPGTAPAGIGIKRESAPQTSGSVLAADWIPAFAGMTGAFAGMTGGSTGSPFQMTAAPSCQITQGMIEPGNAAASGKLRGKRGERNSLEGVEVELLGCVVDVNAHDVAFRVAAFPM